jgi:hypothetical protein
MILEALRSLGNLKNLGNVQHHNMLLDYMSLGTASYACNLPARPLPNIPSLYGSKKILILNTSRHTPPREGR